MSDNPQLYLYQPEGHGELLQTQLSVSSQIK